MCKDNNLYSRSQCVGKESATIGDAIPILPYGHREVTETNMTHLRRKRVKPIERKSVRVINARELAIPWLLSNVLFITLLAVGNADEWNDPCKDGGQCSTMMKSYESLVEGEACRSFYYTGTCATICAFSLKSLVGRRAWTRCSRRCEWASAFVDAASSWLDMCLSHPRHDDDPHHDQMMSAIRDNSSSSLNVTDNILSNTISDSTEQRSRNPDLNRRRVWMTHVSLALYRLAAHLLTRFLMFSFFTGIITIALFYVVSFCFKVPLGTVIQRTSNFIYSAVRRLVPEQKKESFETRARNQPKSTILSSSAITNSHAGVSDTAWRDRPELSSLHRGARRHLKAMRANFD